MTEEKIKDFAYSFLKCSHVFSVLERQDSVVLLKLYFFLCMDNRGIKKV